MLLDSSELPHSNSLSARTTLIERIKRPSPWLRPRDTHILTGDKMLSLPTGGTLTLEKSGGNITANLSSTDGQQKAATLWRLPERARSQRINPTLVLPSGPSQTIQLVLDKGAQTWNQVVGGDEGMQFPAVMQRTVQSVLRSEGKGRALSGSEVVKTITEGVEDHEDQAESDHMS
jgi:hypothetical protein